MTIGDSAIKNKIEHLKIQDNSFLLVKIGSDSRPACTQDLEDIEKVLDELLGKKFPDLPVVVTYHSVNMEIVTVPADRSV